MRHLYAPSGLDMGDAEKMAAILQERLASLIDLSLTLKHVHWNVVGTGFIAIHEMMDAQTDAVRAMVDAVAERITTLGGVAGGLPTQVVEMRSADDEYALGRAPVAAHLGALDKVYERIGSGHREAIEQVSAMDPITEDLLVSQTAQLEMHHWFVRAHLSDVDGRLSTEDAGGQLEAATEAVYALEPAGVASSGDA
jgi:starvation-inducible DNA-binding protein